MHYLAALVYAFCLFAQPFLAFTSPEQQPAARARKTATATSLQKDALHRQTSFLQQYGKGAQKDAKTAPASLLSLSRHLEGTLSNEAPAPFPSIAFQPQQPQQPQIFPEPGYQQQPADFIENGGSGDADISSGLLEWAGTNAGVIQNFFSGNSRATEEYGNPAGGLLGELARANLDFVVKDVPRLISERSSSGGSIFSLPGVTERRRRPLQQDQKGDGSFFRSLVQALAGGNQDTSQPQQPQYIAPPAEDVSEAWRRYQLQQQWIDELRSRLNGRNNHNDSPLSSQQTEHITDIKEPNEEKSRSQQEVHV